jgi:hypothetical protein
LYADSLALGRKLKVQLAKKPQQVISAEISPEFVDFIQYKQ